MFTSAQEPVRLVISEELLRSTAEVRVHIASGLTACSPTLLHHRNLPVRLFLSEDRTSRSSLQGKQLARRSNSLRDSMGSLV